jgi:hypothetical protein
MCRVVKGIVKTCDISGTVSESEMSRDVFDSLTIVPDLTPVTNAVEEGLSC